MNAENRNAPPRVADFARRKERVPRDFDTVAKNYDLMTGMNPGYKKHLRWSAERLAAPSRGRLLDLCCGTGLSTEALRKVYPHAEMDALDGSEGMLAVASRKDRLRDVTFFQGDAMNPEAAGIKPGYDGILMAYGIRNMSDPDACLERLMALLKPGGRICFHEYSVRDSRRAVWTWKLVTSAIIIPSGKLTNPGSDIYAYLRRSVLEFDGVSAFEKRLARHGFIDVRTLPMDGWQRGIVHSFVATRPL